MAGIPAKSLIGKLNATCRRGMEAAAGLCVSRTHFHVEIEHWLLKLIETPGTDLPIVLRHYNSDVNRVKRELNVALDQFKTGNGRGPDLSFEILDAIREAWVLASLEYGANRVRSAHLLTAILNDRSLGTRIKAAAPELNKLNAEQLQKELGTLLAHAKSEETEQEAAAAAQASATGDAPPPGPGSSRTPALDQFTMNLTDRAREGKIDPVLGRDAEIRQVIDIL